MNCRHAEKQIFAERDGALDANQRAALTEHVAQCASCRAVRTNLAAALESWRAASQSVATPDPDREWHTFRRRIRGGIGASGSEPSRVRRMTPWLALPFGAAAAVALLLFVRPPVSSPAPRNVA